VKKLARRSKYNATKVDYDGHIFDSKQECAHYKELKLLAAAGEITALKLQPEYSIEINGQKICRVVLDFSYYDNDGHIRVVDVKGYDNPLSKLKRKLVEATYGIIVEIVK